MEAKGLTLSFEGDRGRFLVVDGFNLTISHGEMVGLVGESGSGKTMTALSVMGLLPPRARVEIGRLLFKGRDLLAISPAERRLIRGHEISMVFQEPMTALNPVLTIGEQVAEIFRWRAGDSRRAARLKAVDLLRRVGLPDARDKLNDYPHRFSGGMRQRVVLAMALALNPDLIIADEPTTALDPTIQAQIVSLMSRLISERGSSGLLITHNLGLVHELTRKTVVMYLGLMMEEALTIDFFRHPAHPYTQALLKALPPDLGRPIPRRLPAIGGQPPAPWARPKGCPFSPRCPQAFKPCHYVLPPVVRIEPGHSLRCHLYC